MVLGDECYHLNFAGKLKEIIYTKTTVYGGKLYIYTIFTYDATTFCERLVTRADVVMYKNLRPRNLKLISALFTFCMLPTSVHSVLVRHTVPVQLSQVG